MIRNENYFPKQDIFLRVIDGLQVCSPGGSTIAGVHELEKVGIRNAFINAIEKAAERNVELGNSKK